MCWLDKMNKIQQSVKIAPGNFIFILTIILWSNVWKWMITLLASVRNLLYFHVFYFGLFCLILFWIFLVLQCYWFLFFIQPRTNTWILFFVFHPPGLTSHSLWIGFSFAYGSNILLFIQSWQFASKTKSDIQRLTVYTTVCWNFKPKRKAFVICWIVFSVM